jgi:hypothetical protein
VIVIKATYSMLRKVGKEEVIAKALLDGHALDVQCFFKKMTMVANSEIVMKEESFVNLVIQLWTKINSFSIFKCKLSKCIKLAEIACVQVLGSVENECCFLVVAFMKNKLRNRLTCHLDLCTCFYTQQFYNIENFPYEEAMMWWKNTKS